MKYNFTSAINFSSNGKLTWFAKSQLTFLASHRFLYLFGTLEYNVRIPTKVNIIFKDTVTLQKTLVCHKNAYLLAALPIFIFLYFAD